MNQTFTMDVEKEIEAALEFSEILKKHGIRGEFYICGSIVEEYPSKVKKIAQHHTLGGHGYNHEDFAKLSYAEAENTIKKTIDTFKKHNLEMEGWRFPGFGFRNSQLKIIANYDLFDSSLRDKTLKTWGDLTFFRNFLSGLKRGNFYFPSTFPSNLKEKPWSHVDLQDPYFYTKEGRLVLHCHKFGVFRENIINYLRDLHKIAK